MSEQKNNLQSKEILKYIMPTGIKDHQVYRISGETLKTSVYFEKNVAIIIKNINTSVNKMHTLEMTSFDDVQIDLTFELNDKKMYEILQNTKFDKNYIEITGLQEGIRWIKYNRYFTWCEIDDFKLKEWINFIRLCNSNKYLQ